jgi:hypothetical protein
LKVQRRLALSLVFGLDNLLSSILICRGQGGAFSGEAVLGSKTFRRGFRVEPNDTDFSSRLSRNRDRKRVDSDTVVSSVPVKHNSARLLADWEI